MLVWATVHFMSSEKTGLISAAGDGQRKLLAVVEDGEPVRTLYIPNLGSDTFKDDVWPALKPNVVPVDNARETYARIVARRDNLKQLQVAVDGDAVDLFLGALAALIEPPKARARVRTGAR